jgi:hypothetical protein
LPFVLLLKYNSYWAIGLHPGARHFWRFTLYLFLGVLTAEFQSILIAAIIPIFVASLGKLYHFLGFQKMNLTIVKLSVGVFLEWLLDGKLVSKGISE